MLTDRRFDVARRWSNHVLRRIAPAFRGEVVNVSGWDDRDKEGGRYRDYFTGAIAYHRTNFAGHNGLQGDPGEIPLDLTADLPTDLNRRFDVVFNHTTLEHVFELRKAFANLCSLSRDVVIVVVPFSQTQHESEDWKDYWRFTPSCLRELFRENGFEVIYEAESPHRHSAIYLVFAGARDASRYGGRMPAWRPIGAAGGWIGSSLLVAGIQFTANRVRRKLGWKSPYE